MSVCLYGTCLSERNEKSYYCDKHEVIANQRRVEEIAEGIENGEFEYEREIICPYCGETIEDDECVYDEDGEHEVECYHCEKNFQLETNISISYSTRVI